MEIDVYQHCPCHSGKKIKFCCGKSVVNELNEIVSKNGAGQPVAALNKIERVIEKEGPLNCLLAIQTHILISQGEMEKARVSNDQFLKANPKHPVGLQHESLILLAEGDVANSVERLQDGMDAITGNEIPISCANSFRMVGLGLAHQGHVFGARAHYQFAQSLKGPADEEIRQLFAQTFMIPNASILLKSDPRIQAPPEDKEWASKYLNVGRAMDRGQFRKALSFLNKLDSAHPDEPVIIHGIAVLHGILGHAEHISDAWRRYSRCEGLSTWDAVEAEALAQLFSQVALTDEIDIVRSSFEIKDVEEAVEAISSHTRFAVLQELDKDPFGEGPAPRHVFYFLDRDKIADASDLTLENVASVSGEVLVYGKQTDRPARLEWVAARNSLFEEFQNYIKTELAEFIDGDVKESVLGETTAVTDVLTWNWHLPKGVTREQHSELVAKQRKKALNEGWANLKFSVLDGKTPKETSNEEQYQIPLNALILHLEQTADAQISDKVAASELRESLGIEPLPEIDPDVIGDTPVSPVRQQYLQIEKLSDEKLLLLHANAMAIANMSVMRRLVPEVLKRESLETHIPRESSLSMMAQLAEGDEEALDYLQQAKTCAKEKRLPIGIFLVQEFELRIQRGMTDKLAGLLQRIQVHHLGEPNVEYQLTRVLQRFGLLGGSRPSAGAHEAPSEAPAQEESAIWTPDQESGAEAGTEDEGSKLWLPE